MKLDAIVTDARQRQALVTVRALGRAGVSTGAVETTAGAPAFYSRWCTLSATVPDFASQPDRFIDALVELCKRHGPQALISCHDGAIEAVRARREDLERVVGVALAPEPALGIAIDKTKTLEAAAALGVRVPRGAIVTALDEADAALEESGLPAVVKPIRSWVRARRLEGELASERRQALQAIEGLLEAGTRVVVQEWLPGAREAVSLVYARGRIWARFAQEAKRMYPPLGGSSILRESIPLPPDAHPAAEKLVTELDLEGYTEVEFRRDQEGRAVLMEINPRLSASAEVAVRAGVPFPRLVYAWAAGERLEQVDGYRLGTRMRWLGGDLDWLESALREREHPDLPPPGRALRAFFGDFMVPAGYDYWDPSDPRPAWVATAAATAHARQRATRRVARAIRATRRHKGPSADTEVALIGAGPYGLSLAAHLTARGVDHEIFGEPMAGWLEHMPPGMKLKSEGSASNLSEPSGEHKLGRFCAERGIEYADIGVPIEIDTFVGYGLWFQERLVPEVRRRHVNAVRRTPAGFELTVDSGDTLRARRVVAASGLRGYARVPAALSGLPAGKMSHSYDHGDLDDLRDRTVVVVGAGQSALETATLLHERGASVTLVARSPALLWNPPPTLGPRRLRTRMRYPRSGLGDGKEVFFYANAPLGFHALPEAKRQTRAFNVLGPAGAWWLRPRLEGHVDARLGREVAGAKAADGEVRLRLDGETDAEELVADHVVAATGYEPDVHQLDFLDPGLREQITCAAGAPRLSRAFESSVPGLYFIGFSAAVSFGPVMRFVYGADFTARRISRHVARAQP